MKRWHGEFCFLTFLYCLTCVKKIIKIQAKVRSKTQHNDSIVLATVDYKLLNNILIHAWLYKISSSCIELNVNSHILNKIDIKYILIKHQIIIMKEIIHKVSYILYCYVLWNTFCVT